MVFRDNKIHEIHKSHEEARNLIILRNTLAYYLNIQSDTSSDTSKLSTPMRLPSPINNWKMCKRCDYNMICHAHVRMGTCDLVEPTNPMASTRRKTFKHLTTQRMRFFIEWMGVLQLESKANGDEEFIRKLWTNTPEERYIEVFQL